MLPACKPPTNISAIVTCGAGTVLQEMNLAMVGSQIVGLVPLKAILDAADYFMEKNKLFILEEDQKIRLVVDRLGLHSLGGFSPKERIIE